MAQNEAADVARVANLAAKEHSQQAAEEAGQGIDIESAQPSNILGQVESCAHNLHTQRADLRRFGFIFTSDMLQSCKAES